MSLFNHIKEKHIQKTLIPAEKKFIQFNKRYWEKGGRDDGDGMVLVEGLLGPMPTHLVRLGIAAKAVEQSLGLKPLVVVANRKMKSIQLFGSFGITEFIYLNRTRIGFRRAFYIFRQVINIFFDRRVDNLLRLEYRSFKIGKQIYDSILKSYDDCYTIDQVRLKHFIFILGAYIFAARYEAIIDQNPIKLVLLSHNEYLWYGTLSIAAMIHKKDVMVINGFETSFYRTPEKLYWHKRFNAGICDVLKNTDIKVLEKEGSEYLQERISGESGLFDTKNAYGGKRLYTRQMLKEACSQNDKKNVFIFMHVFSDAPHLSDFDLYRDYYDWIVDTMDQIKRIDSVNWYVKVHPSAFLYGESDRVKELIQVNKYNNIFFPPEDFSPASLREVADVIITCQGTVGIEASCQGIPIIVTGEPFYKGFGFDLSPKTKEEYYELLHKCDSIPTMNEKKRRMALAVMGAFNRVKYIDKSILDDEVYEYGGYGETGINYDIVYGKLCENMSRFKYDQLPFFKRIQLLLDEEYKNVNEQRS